MTFPFSPMTNDSSCYIIIIIRSDALMGGSNITISNVSGRIIKSHDSGNIDYTMTEKISMNGYVSGIYFVRLHTQSGTQVRKIFFEKK